MRCIAIDDEPIALSIIDNYCKRDPSIELSTYTNPLEGIKAIGSQRPDIVFLDIEMNDYSGLEIARELPPDTILIFTTAHASYALEGYEVKALDFLHKPFAYDRFEAALERARQILDVRSKASLAEPEAQSFVTIKVDYKNVNIPTSEITHVEARDNYIKIYTDRQTAILTKMSIKCFMDFLPPRGFIRIHRSFVVAKSSIASYTKQQIKLKSGFSLPVGRIYAEELYSQMLEDSF